VGETRTEAARLLGILALVLIAGGLTTTIALLALRRDLNPFEHGVSFYALGPNGHVQALAIGAVALGSLLLAVGLRRTLPNRRETRWGTACLAAWAGLIAVAAVVPLDVTPPMSIGGIVHDIAGNGANLFLIAALLLLRRTFADLVSWRSLFIATLPLALTALAAVVVANVARPVLPWGVGQRIYLLLLLTWLVLAAFRLAAFRPHDGDTPPRESPGLP
jgi:hypothetical protein